MLREPATRGGGAVKQAELLLHWPTLEGYTQALAADFIDGSPAAPMVYATIAPRSIALDPGARLDGIYSKHFVGDPLPAPTGLTARRLGAESGYSGEIVYFAAAAPERFVARCVAESTPEIPATCLRDLKVGKNLALTYRFNRDIILEWVALDDGMRALRAAIAPPR
jgi:hypothetical protein